jgi:hypothetical protein
VGVGVRLMLMRAQKDAYQPTCGRISSSWHKDEQFE